MTLTPASLAEIEADVRIIHDANERLSIWHLHGVDELVRLCQAISHASHHIRSEVAYNAIHPRSERPRTQPSPRVAKTVSIDDL
jgi:hypothetical protein